MISVRPGKSAVDRSVGVTGLLARLAGILAGEEIPIFASSTYDTDYILVRDKHLDKAVHAFEAQDIEVDLIP